MKNKKKYLADLIRDFYLEDVVTVDDLKNLTYDQAITRIQNIYEDTYMKQTIVSVFPENTGVIVGTVKYTA